MSSYCLFDAGWRSRSSESTFFNRLKNVSVIKCVLEDLIKKIQKLNLCSRSSVSTEMRDIKKVTVKCAKVSVRLCHNMVQKPSVFTSKRKAVLLFAISALKKFNPIEPARMKALNGNRILWTFFSLSVNTIRSVRSFSWTITWNLRFLKCVINSV